MFAPSSTTRAISAARRNGAPSIRPGSEADRPGVDFLLLLLVGQPAPHGRNLLLRTLGLGWSGLKRQSERHRPGNHGQYECGKSPDHR